MAPSPSPRVPTYSIWMFLKLYVKKVLPLMFPMFLRVRILFFNKILIK